MWRLVDAMQNEKSPLRMGVLQVFWFESNAMAVVEFETYPRLDVTIQRLLRTSLTKPGWVAIRDSYSEATPEFDPVTEQTYKIGRDIDTPRDYPVLEGQYEDLRALGTEASLKAIAYEFNEGFINGPYVNSDGSANPNAFTGIRQRIKDYSLQSGLSDALNALTAQTNFGPTASSANRQTVFDSLNKAIYFVDGHQPDWAFSNKDFLLALESALRRENLFNQNRDQFDRFVYKWRGVEFYDIGLKADQVTQIITNTENGADGTSVFFGKNGVETHFWCWEAIPLDVRDLGELPTAPVLRTRIDWTLGLLNPHPRALAQVQNILALT